MCRNIKVLFHFDPPTTREEMSAAAVQYVRKVSGTTKPSAADREAFERAVDEITAATERLLGALHPRGQPRTRESERAKAKARWEKRAERVKAS